MKSKLQEQNKTILTFVAHNTWWITRYEHLAPEIVNEAPQS